MRRLAVLVGFAAGLIGCWAGGAQSRPGSNPDGAARVGPVLVWPGVCTSVRRGPGGRTRTERIYDGRRLVSVVVTEGDSASGRVSSRRFHYDERGKKARVDIFENDGRHSQWLLYDDKGRWIATQTDATGQRDIMLREERGYDDLGRITFRRTVDTRAGAVLELHTHRYDDAGRLVEEIFENLRPGQQRRQSVELRHDARDRVVERLHRDLPDRTLVQRDIYAYGPSGRLHALTRTGEVRQTHRYHHDEVGNLLRSEVWNEDGEPVSATVFDYSCWQD